MLWNCPKCSTVNPAASKYCQTCGERKVGENPLKLTSVRSQASINSKTSLGSKAQRQPEDRCHQIGEKFNRILKPTSFEALEVYAALATMFGFVCYLAGVIGFIYLLSKGEETFFVSITTGLTFGVIGFGLQVIGQVMYLFLQGSQSWFLTAKYTYVNSNLTDELLQKIEALEAQVDCLTKEGLKENSDLAE